MKLPEFITYCKLKDLVVVHERLDNEWHADKVNRQILVVENDNFVARITYVHFASKYHILDTELAKVSILRDEPWAGANFETIVSKFA